MLAADVALTKEIRGMRAQAVPLGVTVIASGEQSIAAHTIFGVAITGDNIIRR